MRHLGILLALLFACGAAYADPAYVALEANVGATISNTVTDTANPRGYVDEVLIQMPASMTAAVWVVASPNVGTGLPATWLYSNATAAASVKARPRVAQTDATGSNLSSLSIAERYLCNGDPVTLYVAQSSLLSNQAVKVWLKIDK